MKVCPVDRAPRIQAFKYFYSRNAYKNTCLCSFKITHEAKSQARALAY